MDSGASAGARNRDRVAGLSHPKTSESVIRCMRERTKPSRKDASKNSGAPPSEVDDSEPPACGISFHNSCSRAIWRDTTNVLSPASTSAFMYSMKGLRRPANR